MEAESIEGDTIGWNHSDKTRDNDILHLERPRTRPVYSLVSDMTPERITQEMVQCAREGDDKRLDDIIMALGEDVEKQVNALDDNSLTPLHYAAQYNQDLIVTLLINEFADVNIRGDEGATPAHYAAMPTRGTKITTDRDDRQDGGSSWLSGGSSVRILRNQGADFTLEDKYGQTPLHYAAIHGNVNAARDIIDVDHPENLIEAADDQHMRALHVAAIYDEVGIARLLLDHGADIRSRDHENSTALHHACASGNLVLVKMLFDVVAKSDNGKEETQLLVADQDIEGSTCLHLAVENGHTHVVRLCIEKGADVNQARNDRMYPLHLAVVSGKAEIVRHLANKGAKIDAENESQATPLHKAAQYNRVKAAKLLIKKGADIEYLDRDHDSPLMIAAVFGHVDMTEMLLKKGAEIVSTNLKEKTVVYAAAEEGNALVLQRLFEEPYARTLINWVDRNGNTPLHVAAKKKHIRVVKILLKNNAQIQSKNEVEETPLHLAAKHGNVNIIREIVSYGQNSVFAEDENSNTPLQFAALYGHTHSVSVLIQLGSDVAQKNWLQLTALDMAASQGWNNTCLVLLEADCPIDPVDKSNSTPLHLACSNGHTLVVDLLLKWNASVSKVDKDGMNCLDLAIENNHSDVARQIIQSDKWVEALRHVHVKKTKLNTPMRRLIRKMPEVAKEVFDRCITPGNLKETDPTDENYALNYNYEFIDDLYAKWTQPGGTKRDIKTKKKLFEGKTSLPAYTYDSKAMKENHPLWIMVAANQEHLLAHPLVTSLISHKWLSFGAWFHLLSLTLHVVFISFLTSYSLQLTSPYQYTAAEVEAIESGRCSDLDSSLHQSQGVKNEKFVLIFTVVICMINEFGQMYQSKLSYFSVNNGVELVAYVLTILLVIDFNGCQTTTGYRFPWQWSMASIAMFLSWIDLMLYVQGLSSLGIYVVMFRDILITFLKAISVFCLLIIAFAMGFFILLQNQIPFRSVGSSLMKTFVMIIGEYDFNDIFNAGGDGDVATQLNYPTATYILFTCFVVLASIVLMNLLVGLAVDDIKGILRQAALKRMAMQVGLTLDAERILPDFLRQRYFLPMKTVEPNKVSPNVFKRLAACLPSWWQFDPAEDEDAVLREIPEIRKTQDTIRKEIKEIKRIVKVVYDMHIQNKRIEGMLSAIVKNSENVTWSEEDYSSDEDRTLL